MSIIAQRYIGVNHRPARTPVGLGALSPATHWANYHCAATPGVQDRCRGCGPGAGGVEAGRPPHHSDASPQVGASSIGRRPRPMAGLPTSLPGARWRVGLRRWDRPHPRVATLLARAMEAVGGRSPRAAWRGEPQLVECGLQRMALSMPPTRRGSEALPLGGVTRSQQTPQDPRDLTLRTSGAQWWLRLAVAPPRLRAPTPEGPRPTFHSAWPCSCHERDQGHQDPRPPPNPAGRVDCLGLTLKSCGHPGPGGAGRTGRRGQRSGRSPLVCSHRCSIKRGNRTSLWTNPAPPPCSRESPMGTWTAGRRVQHRRSAISGAVERLAWGPNDGPPDRLWGKHRAPGGWRCTARSPKLTVGSLWHAGLL